MMMRARSAVCVVSGAVLTAALVAADGLGDAAARVKAARAQDGNVASCGTDAQVPKLIRNPEPSYPPAALAEGVSGRVELVAVVSKDGAVRAVEVEPTGADARLVDAARAQVLARKYCPAFERGVPIDSRVPIIVNFKARRRR